VELELQLHSAELAVHVAVAAARWMWEQLMESAQKAEEG
jgi:hypothetical protein